MSESETSDLLLQAIRAKLATCQMRVRRYQPADRDACLEIHRSNEPDYLAPGGINGFIKFLQSGPACHCYLVIEVEGRIVACGGIEQTAEPSAISLVYGLVHRQFHRRGLGTTLLAARLSLLQPEGDVITVWMTTSLEAAPFYGLFRFNLHTLYDRTGPERDDGLLWLNVSRKDIARIQAALGGRGIHVEMDTAGGTLDAGAGA